MSSSPLQVGVVFGGVSPEHEVSVISSLQAAAALDRSRYRPVPVYIAKDGAWYTGDRLMDIAAYQDLDELRRQATRVTLDPGSYRTLDLVPVGGGAKLRLDVLFLGLHGGDGENGGLQGLCETFNVPFTGSGIFGSAIGIDKVLSKRLCQQAGIPIVAWHALRESDWGGREEACMDEIEAALGYPVIVKPARLGSSIGIARADDRAELDAAIEEAFRYDDKVVIEDAVEALREVNCSILGSPHAAQASVLEEPIRSESDETLTFQDKYLRGGGGKQGPARGSKRSSGAGGMASLDRRIPAPLSPDQTAAIQRLAVDIFQLFECGGVARIDFMIDEATGEHYFNEINTIPGSFSFYLWDPPRDVPDEALPGPRLDFTALTSRMIELALERHAAKNGRVRSYETNLLSQKSIQGLKGAKGR